MHRGKTYIVSQISVQIKTAALNITKDSCYSFPASNSVMTISRSLTHLADAFLQDRCTIMTIKQKIVFSSLFSSFPKDYYKPYFFPPYPFSAKY